MKFQFKEQYITEVVIPHTLICFKLDWRYYNLIILFEVNKFRILTLYKYGVKVTFHENRGYIIVIIQTFEFSRNKPFT